MTFEEIKKSNKDFLIPADVAEILGCSAYSINQQAAKNIKDLGFNASKIGSRVKIPRIAFINFMEGKTETKLNKQQKK